MAALNRALGGAAAVPALMALYLLPRALLLLVPLDPVSDARWYFERAAGLAAGLGYVEDGVPTAYWPPGWPLALGLLFKVFGASVLVAQLFNLACAAAIAWLTLDLGRRLFESELAGRTALLLLAVYPNAIGYVPQVLTEVFYTALLLLGCWLLVAARAGVGLVLGGLVFGAASLVKAQTLVVVPLIFGVAALREGLGARRLLLAAARSAVVIALAALVVLPWSMRNHGVLGEWVAISTNGGMTLLTGNNPSARGGYTDRDPLVTSIVRTVPNQIADDREARRRAEAWIRDNPGRFLALMPMKLFRLWGPDGEAEWGYQAGYRDYERHAWVFRAIRLANQAYYVLLMAGFVLAGALLAAGRMRVGSARFGWWALCYAVAAYPSAIAMVFSGQSRFHYPVMPFVVMCCGYLLAAWPPRRPRGAVA